MRVKLLIAHFLLIAALLCAETALAQIPAQDTTARTRLEPVQDSSDVRMTDTIPPRPIDEILRTTSPKNGEFHMTKSPTGAILRSLALPGWGQVYVENYWKAPIFLGAAGISAYNIVHNHKLFSQKQDEIDSRSASLTAAELDLLKRQRDAYRDNRDLSGLSLMVVYLVSAIDAYVGAHLYDFTVEDQAALQFTPSGDGGLKAGLRLSW